MVGFLQYVNPPFDTAVPVNRTKVKMGEAILVVQTEDVDGSHARAVQAGATIAVMSLVSTVFSLVAEQQTTLKAGTLGGLHGGFVLLIMALFAVAKLSPEAPRSLALGIGLWALALGVLAMSPVPVHSGLLIVALLFMSIGEALTGPNLMALGSRLAGLSSNAYWAAATLGYWGCMAYNLGWLERGQANHFGYVALGCAVLALLAVVARRLRP